MASAPVVAKAAPPSGDDAHIVRVWHSDGQAPPPRLIRVRGNYVFNEETYTSVLGLPADAIATPETADRVREALLRFLRNAGYVLGRVSVTVEDDYLDVEMDEGRLDKIVFVGTGTIEALRLKLDLNVPHHVFNRPDLERQLVELSTRYGLKNLSYELLWTHPVAHSMLQLGDLGSISGYAVIPPEVHFVLYVRVHETDWNVGLNAGLTLEFPDGLSADVGYRGQALLLDLDRWRVRAELGARLRNRIETNATYLALSRATIDARWYTPPLFFQGLRPFVWVGDEVLGFQRRDLDLERFYRNRTEGSLNVGYELIPGLTLSVGGGIEEKIIFGVEQVQPADPNEPFIPVRGFDAFHPFAHSDLEFIFNLDEIRRDRLHALELSSRHYWMTNGAALNAVYLKYAKVFAIGWDDLEISARGAYLRGNVEFDFEEPVGGRYARGVFGDRFYVKKVGSVSAEFRWSLVRDLYKLSVFHDLVAFDELDRLRHQGRLRVGDSLGPGFHALILDVFQLNIYYAFGFCTDGTFDHGFAASILKAF